MQPPTLHLKCLCFFLPCDLGEVPLAESKCEAEWGGRYGPAVQDQRGRHCGKSQEKIHGRLHLCILQSDITSMLLLLL